MKVLKYSENISVTTMGETVHGVSDKISIMPIQGTMKLYGLTDAGASVVTT